MSACTLQAAKIMPSGSREKITSIINNAFVKNDKGELHMVDYTQSVDREETKKHSKARRARQNTFVVHNPQSHQASHIRKGKCSLPLAVARAWTVLSAALRPTWLAVMTSWTSPSQLAR
jgi:hypothetical protein